MPVEIPGQTYATLNGQVVKAQGTGGALYHGADAKSLGLPGNLNQEQIAQYLLDKGLNARGFDIELMRHQAGNSNTAFRGTTNSLVSQEADAGALYWAGPEGVVVKLKPEVKGYDLNALQSTTSQGIGIGGRAQQNSLAGELEISVPALIKPNQIANVGKVVTNEKGAQRIEWILTKDR